MTYNTGTQQPTPKVENPSELREITKAIKTFGVMADVEKWEKVGIKRELRWTGPKICIGQWREVLAFFKFIMTRDNSEAHVRMFASKEGWRFHAFPQEARRGMMAKEIESDPTFEEQRGRYRESQGHYPLGSAHSHLNMSAFQSGGDWKDEKSWDGLHITVGHMGSDKWDIHGRFLLSGGNGAKMVDIKDWSPFVELPPEILPWIPEEMLSEVAEHMLTTPPPEGQMFPEEWALNVKSPPPLPKIEVTPTTTYGQGYSYNPHWISRGAQDYGKFPDYKGESAQQNPYTSTPTGRTDRQLVTLAEEFYDIGIKDRFFHEADLEEILSACETDEGEFLIRFCKRHGCTVAEITEGCSLSHTIDIKNEEKEDEKEEKKADDKGTQQGPDESNLWDHYMQ